MEAYRRKLKREVILYGVVMAVSIIMVSVSYIIYRNKGGESHLDDFALGFQTGLFFAWAAIMVYGMVRCIRALRNEEILKKLYIEEHDERSIMVYTKARATAYQISLIGMMIAAVIAGFYSSVVFYTLFTSLLVISLIGGGCKFFYHRRL